MIAVVSKNLATPADPEMLSIIRSYLVRIHR